jgi:hypothetical protein
MIYDQGCELAARGRAAGNRHNRCEVNFASSAESGRFLKAERPSMNYNT